MWTSITLAPFHEDTWESGGIAPPFLTLALNGGERSSSCPSHFSPPSPWETAYSTHCVGGWVIPRVSLDIVEKTKISCPAKNQILTF
jgi:hypothetical protein